MERELVEKVFPGSPAGAGIDPPLLVLAMVRRWFPRRRGDRPWVLHIGARVIRVPPQARG